MKGGRGRNVVVAWQDGGPGDVERILVWRFNRGDFRRPQEKTWEWLVVRNGWVGFLVARKGIRGSCGCHRRGQWGVWWRDMFQWDVTFPIYVSIRGDLGAMHA